MSANCLFCKIAARQIPAKIVYEDADVFAFADINAQAPTHLLICPKEHFASLEEATERHEGVLGRMALAAAKLAKEMNLGGGYRTVVNTGPGAGQTVFHLHMHLLGGREFSWPPG
ncbi:MAG: histidine triad nucleotide-binding protein [Acidobacteria bacterium]|nr:histidine triad nucleotide-binding protein [Acidobacteriota bacterium]MBS1865394.1 histidine triad nucleotide-binding protein [Acidobacteriota bacterium]